MKWSQLLLAFFALLVLVDAQPLQAQTFAVKGVLRDPLGRTVEDGSYKLTLRLYNQDAGGTAIFTEIHASVPVQHGVFSVELGSVESLAGVSFLNALWLGIQVEAENEMAPRIKLTPAPYSLGVIGAENRFPSTGNVGVGVAAPQSKLDVEGGAAIGANYSGNVAAPTDGLIVEGRVGIGTAIPGEKLDVNGKIRASSIIFTGDNSELNSASLGGTASALSSEGGAAVPINAGGDVEISAGGARRMTIKTDGTVGIGTDNPTAEISNAGLRLVGNRHVVVDNSYGIFSVHRSGSGYGAGLDTGSDDGLIFYTDGLNARMNIKADGNVGIGVSNPSQKLEVDGNIRTTGSGVLFGYSAELRRSGGDLNAPDVYGQGNLVLGGGGGGGGSVVTSGKIGIGTGVPLTNLHVQADNPGRPQVMYLENKNTDQGSGASLIFVTNGGNNGTGGIGTYITSNGLPITSDVRISTISGGNWQDDVLTVAGNRTVGINATAPTQEISNAKLRVGGGGHVVVDNNFGLFSVHNSGSGFGAGFDTHTDDSMGLFTGGYNERIKIEAGGNVGIGTSDPDATLDVAGTVRMMGGYQGRNRNQDYTEPTDGFVTAYCSSGAGSHVRAEGYVNGLKVQQIDVRDNNWGTTLSIMFPVHKGGTWRVSNGNGNCTVYFMPLGHN